MWPKTSCTSWLWILAFLSTGQGYLFMLDLCDKSGCSTQPSGLCSSQATCFWSRAEAQAHVACFSISSATILQFLFSYLHTSSAEVLLFSSSDQSSKSTAARFLHWVVLLVVFWTPAGCIDHRTQHCCPGGWSGCTDLFQERASTIFAGSRANPCSQEPHGKQHVSPSAEMIQGM